MKINKLIKDLTKEYIPLTKFVNESKKNGTEVTKTIADKFFKLHTTLEFYKIIKGMFMEEVTKNKKMTQDLINEGLLSTHIEQADKDGKSVDVIVVDQSMNERVDLIPASVYIPMFEKMVKNHMENIAEFTKRNDTISIIKEQLELDVLNNWLPKEASEQEILSYLNDHYPNGVEKKLMGKVMGEVKSAFDRVNGKLASECIRKILV